MAGDITPIAHGMMTVDRFAVKLGKKYVSNRVEHGFGSSLKQVREADEYHTFTQPDRIVNICEVVKADFEFRHGSARAQLPISLLEQRIQGWNH